MRTWVGPMEDTSAMAYLRPETAQGIFVNFKNIYQTARKRPPFGVAQIGKSFRNEITPGNFTFRLREFEQAELEYFVPDDGRDMEAFHEWVQRRKAWYGAYGIASERLRFYELSESERPHYAKAGIDVEYLFPWGWGELESIAHRGTYDLDAHIRLSGKDLRFFDEATKTQYTPLLIESSAGVDRTVLTFMIDAYERERSVDPNGKETERNVLRFHPQIAPVQAAVFSLARNKPELVERARSIEASLRANFRTQYDEGNIGQLYRRQDEIGTPFCVTVDYETLDDGSVTVRARDSMLQERVATDGLTGYLREALTP
jgi:glycyl-tRNA synthetase